MKITLDLPDTTISGYMAFTWRNKDGEILVTTPMLTTDITGGLKDGTVVTVGEREE